jgi:hypothetical protein
MYIAVQGLLLRYSKTMIREEYEMCILMIFPLHQTEQHYSVFQYLVRLENFRSMKTEVAVFWVMTSCSDVVSVSKVYAASNYTAN